MYPAKKKEKKMKRHGQEAVQGDVVISRSNVNLKGMERVPCQNGRLILAKGESTGHAHSINDTDAELWQDPRNQNLYLVAKKEVTLTHEEHAPVTITVGIYTVGIVQEYDYFLEETRNVVD